MHLQLIINKGMMMKSLPMFVLSVTILASSSALAITRNVDCSVGETITHALQRAQAGDTVRITGTCNETIKLTKDDITLDGRGTTIIDGGGSTQAVITIDAARRIVVKRLTVQHGANGLLAARGTSVALENIVAQDNDDSGIQIDENTTARLTNCRAIQNGKTSGRDGIRVFRTASVTLNGNIVANDNGRAGIHLSLGAAAFVETGATVTVNQNARFGLLANANSVFTLTAGDPTLIAQDNGDRGVAVFENSSFSAYGGKVTIQRNTGGGLQAIRNAFARLQGTGLVATISNNGMNGVEINQDASVRFDQDTTIRNNSGRGFWFINGSQGNLTNIVVRDNDAAGIDASDTSLQLTGSTLSGNGGANVTLHFGTRALMDQNPALSNIVCDSTVISSGNNPCP